MTLFYVLFNIISVLSGQWLSDNERLCAMKTVDGWKDSRLQRICGVSNPGPLDQQASAKPGTPLSTAKNDFTKTWQIKVIVNTGGSRARALEGSDRFSLGLYWLLCRCWECLEISISLLHPRRM